MSHPKPRVLFVSRERHKLPLDETQRRKWDAIGELLDYRILAVVAEGPPVRSDRLRLAGTARPRALDGALHYLRLPRRIARELREFQPDAALVQGVHEMLAFRIGRMLARVDTKAVLDVQGDWRTATRLYGSPARRLLSPLNDAVGVIAVRSADATRTLSRFTSTLVRVFGVEPTAEFPPFVDSAAFLASSPAPLPERPKALFVGVLERYKGFDTLVAAWPRVRAELPDATLHVVGRGTLAPLARALTFDDGTWTDSLSATGVAAAMDESTLLCLPSRAEGLGRVVIEAMCRGRAIVGGNAGGIPDLVDDGVNGALVRPGDAVHLAAALVRVLGDREDAERLGREARRSGEKLSVTPEQYASRLAGVVEEVLGR